MSFVAWRILTFKFERPSHFAESAPSRRRVEISSVASFNRIRVGQLDNVKTALTARSPLHAPAAPSYAGWAAGSGASCKGRASASPLAMGASLLRSLGPLGRMKAGRFRALPLARSVLSRAFRHCPWPAVCSVANYDAKGPYAANRGGVWPHRNPAEHGATRSTASTPQTLRPPPAASPVPNTLPAAVHAPGPRRPSPFEQAA